MKKLKNMLVVGALLAAAALAGCGSKLSLIHIYSAPAVTVGALRISWRKPMRARV